jgi:PKD repeat protein
VSGTNWTFAGGSPGTSTSNNPTIVYNTPGVYSVTLQATDGSTTLTNTKTNYIVVLGNPGDALPYFEGFETLSTFPDYQRFTSTDEDGDEEWLLTSTAFSSGAKSLKLNNFGTTQVGTIDAFSSGAIDLSGVDPADDIVFNFRYAYRKKAATDDEWLRFYVSKDCGETWILRKQWHGNALSAVTATGAYTPPDETAWYSAEVTNINSVYYVANFRYKFEFENDGGNNMYIDDINLHPASMTEIAEETPISGLSIYPNPVNDMMEIRLDILESADYSITLINTIGELVSVVYQGELVAGTNQLSYSAATLAKGIYFLRIESNGIIETRKVVKN